MIRSDWHSHSAPQHGSHSSSLSALRVASALGRVHRGRYVDGDGHFRSVLCCSTAVFPRSVWPLRWSAYTAGATWTARAEARVQRWRVREPRKINSGKRIARFSWFRVAICASTANPLAAEELSTREPSGQLKRGKNQLKIARFGQRLRNELSVGPKRALRSMSELGWVPPQEMVFSRGEKLGWEC